MSDLRPLVEPIAVTTPLAFYSALLNFRPSSVPAWTTGVGIEYFSYTFVLGETVGEWIEIDFYGPVLGMVASVGPDNGIIDAYVDGVKVKTIDLYQSAWKETNRITMIATNLGDTKHTVRFVITGKNPASAGTRFELQGILVASTRGITGLPPYWNFHLEALRSLHGGYGYFEKAATDIPAGGEATMLRLEPGSHRGKLTWIGLFVDGAATAARDSKIYYDFYDMEEAAIKFTIEGPKIVDIADFVAAERNLLMGDVGLPKWDDAAFVYAVWYRPNMEWRPALRCDIRIVNGDSVNPTHKRLFVIYNKI